MALVGIQSGFDRFGANGKAEYKERMSDEWTSGGVVDGDGGNRRW
jgi:hypothetical protein